MDNFGQFIKRLRTEKKFNQTKLAAQLDLDTGALSKIETGKKRLNVKLLPKLAEIFELDIEKIKEQYFSDEIAKVIYKNNVSETVFKVAEEKVKYLLSKNIKQGKLKI